MIVRIGIRDDETNEESIIQYDDAPSGPFVVWGTPGASKDLHEKIRKYLTKKRDFNIPLSEEDDEYEVVEALPIESTHYFELTLSSMFGNIGVRLLKEITE